MLTTERLQELLHYEPATGVFTWRVKTGGNGVGGRIKAGTIAGSLTPGAYRRIRIDTVVYRAHRLAWFYVHGVWPTNHIDHIDGDRTNDSLVNLRDVTYAVNQQNQRRPQIDNISGYLGVGWHSSAGKWRARIRVGGREKYLGSFLSPKEAHEAYLTAKRKHHEGCTI